MCYIIVQQCYMHASPTNKQALNFPVEGSRNEPLLRFPIYSVFNINDAKQQLEINLN